MKRFKGYSIIVGLFLAVYLPIILLGQPVLMHRRAAFRGNWTANNAILSPSDGSLVAGWQFSNGAFLTDSINAHTLTNVGSSTQSSSGKYGYCLEVNGSSQYVYSDDHVDFAFGTGSFTISVWFNADTAGNYDTIMSTYADSDPDWMIRFSLGEYSYYETSGGDHKGGTVTTGTWRHAVIVRDADNSNRADLYIDGSSVVNFTDSNNYSNNHSIDIGWGLSTNYFDGKIDEPMVWKGVALDSTEVSALYNFTAGSFWRQ